MRRMGGMLRAAKDSGALQKAVDSLPDDADAPQPQPTGVQLSPMERLQQSYEGWILDQFGVLHDGGTAFPLALIAVERLRLSGKRCVILSNSSKRRSFPQAVFFLNPN